MASAVEWQELKYKEVFEQELRGLERRKAYDPSCTIEDLRATLQHLYIMEGSDWGGRGVVQDTILKATIAAYEQFLAEWEIQQKIP